MSASVISTALSRLFSPGGTRRKRAFSSILIATFLPAAVLKVICRVDELISVTSPSTRSRGTPGFVVCGEVAGVCPAQGATRLSTEQSATINKYLPIRITSNYVGRVRGVANFFKVQRSD